ncbi:hypothetical protein C8Q77DRAFT_120287 [Trametes polyzona]|nr:hypothetical protein C8Q77DRAFT_120287 [Trametes polyzona]
MGLNRQWYHVWQPGMSTGLQSPINALGPASLQPSSNDQMPTILQPLGMDDMWDQSRRRDVSVQLIPIPSGNAQPTWLLQLLPQHDYRYDNNAQGFRGELDVPFNNVLVVEALHRRGVDCPDEPAFPYGLDIGDKLSICFKLWQSPLEKRVSPQFRVRHTKNRTPISRVNLAYRVAEHLHTLIQEQRVTFSGRTVDIGELFLIRVQRKSKAMLQPVIGLCRQAVSGT